MDGRAARAVECERGAAGEEGWRGGCLPVGLDDRKNDRTAMRVSVRGMGRPAGRSWEGQWDRSFIGTTES